MQAARLQVVSVDKQPVGELPTKTVVNSWGLTMNRLKMPRIFLISVVIIASTIIAGGTALTASAATEATYYVSPSGSGSTCSSSSPCSLATAQSTVEGLTSSMTGDLVVELEAGTYDPSSAWTLTSADSGENGYNVIYEAVSGQQVVISGGTSITGWTLHDTINNIYEASVPSGFDTRQIYVNGQVAQVDSEAASAAFGTMTQTSTGFTYTNSGPNSWSNAASVDLVYPNSAQVSYRWEYSMCPASTISSDTVVEQDPCYSNAESSDGLSVTVPTAVENNYAILTTPGQFYLDTSANEIYYIPLPGQNMSTASVTAGGLQTLVDIAGTSTNPVKHVEFSGLQFEYSTWLFGDEGELDAQANVLYTTSTDADTWQMMPASVACHSCQEVSFSGDTFEHLGAGGLSFDGGGSNDAVTGNVFTDIAGDGVSIGVGARYTQPTTLESGDTVNDNYIYNIANAYLGGVGILATWVENTTVDHNEVWDTPYTGISLGWGWGDSSSSMVNNHVDDNYVHDVMTSSLSDGGAIYVNGTQGSSSASTIEGNYINQDSQPQAALYLDNGSTYWTVENNVIGGYAPNWVFVTAGGTGAPSADYNTVEYNYAESSAGGILGTPPSDNTVASNSTGLTSWPTGATTIIGSSGLESAYVGLLNSSPQTNLAYGTSDTVSSTWSGLSPSNANDESVAAPWASASGDTSPSWQTDLGASDSLTDIQVLFRQDGYDQPATRADFEILVSNSPSLTSGYTVACTQGATPLPYEDRYDCQPPAGNWEYVSVVKTDTNELVLGQLRVFGTASSGGSSYSVNDDVTGTGTNQFDYSGTWGYCSSCSEANGLYDGDAHYSLTASSTVSFTFTGTQVELFGVNSPDSGIADVSLDGGTAVPVDFYASTRTEDAAFYTSPSLTSGSHTVVVTVTGTKDSSATNYWFTMDRALVSTTSSGTSVNDDVTGTGTNQFDYSGTWGYCSSCSEANGLYDGDNHYSDTTSSSVSFTFTGTQVELFGVNSSDSGIADVSVDGGTAVAVDLYSATRTEDVAFFTSATLSSGSHTVTVTVTGTKNSSSSNYWVCMDRALVTS